MEVKVRGVSTIGATEVVASVEIFRSPSFDTFAYTLLFWHKFK